MMELAEEAQVITYQELHSIISRYLGRIVSVTTYGHQRILGRLKQIGNESIILGNSILLDELEGSRWQDEVAISNLDDGVESGNHETVISFHQIVAVSCNDQNIDEFDISPPVNTILENISCAEPPTAPSEENSVHGFAERIEIRLGLNLVSLAVKDESLSIQERVARLRESLKTTLGFSVPSVRIRDCLELSPDQYLVKVHGSVVAKGTLKPGHRLALLPDNEKGELIPESFPDPVFGLKATWVADDSPAKTSAEQAGWTLVDPITVLMTHLESVTKDHAEELFSYQSATDWLNELRLLSPALADDHFVQSDQRLRLHRVLSDLIAEGIWIQPMEKIAEAIAWHQEECSEYDELLTRVRLDIAGQLPSPQNIRSRLKKIVLQISETENGDLACLEQSELKVIQDRLDQLDMPDPGQFVLVVDRLLRSDLARYLRKRIPGLRVLSDQEARRIPDLCNHAIIHLDSESLENTTETPQYNRPR